MVVELDRLKEVEGQLLQKLDKKRLKKRTLQRLCDDKDKKIDILTDAIYAME